jgi:hypothetical protein
MSLLLAVLVVGTVLVVVLVLEATGLALRVSRLVVGLRLKPL